MLSLSKHEGLIPAPAFLGVERSLTGRRWRLRSDDDRAALMLAQRLGQPEIVGRVLAARGVGCDEAERFLNPSLREQLPDPSGFRDMDRAAERLARAIAGGETIAVFGDYDVDGATASALLRRFVTASGGSARVYIPDRITEGYGPNLPALLRLKAEGAGVVVTVDCGATAHEPLAGAAAAGVEVIVVDHHQTEERLPPAFAFVNPNRLDETTPHRQLAAVGVAFLLAVAVNRRLRRDGWYATRAEPDLRDLLDLVALGTVADVVPLTGVNRMLVAKGLEVLAKRGNAGIAALADVAGLRARCEAYHCGFVLGPRVNAGGRVGAADLGARLLVCDEPIEARALAERLDALNRERQAIEAAVLQAAILRVEEDGADAPVVVAAGEGWHPGVIGIVASRLRERYNRPCCVVALENGAGKGSGRSADGFDLGQAIIAARQAGLLVNGGGHANAAGFTVAADRIAALRAFLAERARAVMAADTVPRLSLDGALALAGATPALVETLERVGPFGQGNPQPRFAFPAARVVKADIVGSDHVRCILADQRGGRLNAIAFRSAGGPLGQALLNGGGAALHLAGQLRADDWQGNVRVQLHIDDAAPAGAA